MDPQKKIVPYELWYRSRILKEPLSSIAAEFGCSKNKIKLIVTSCRWKQGEVVMSRQWMVERILKGWTVKQIAGDMWCCERLVYYRISRYGLTELYRKHRPRGPGSPNIKRG